MEPAGQAPEARALSASAAFQALADEHLDDAYRLARVILHDEADARDATHDAFVRAWRSWSSLRVTRESSAVSTIVPDSANDTSMAGSHAKSPSGEL